MHENPFAGSLDEVGRRESLLSAPVVGFMRRLALTAAGAAALGAGALAYAHLESRWPVLRRLTVPVPGRNWPGPLRVLQVTDLHMFPGQSFIGEFLERVATENTIDLVISTGDNLGAANGLAPLLDAYQPLLSYPGAFVLGSNDYYSPTTHNWLSYLRKGRGSRAAQRGHRDRPDLPWTSLVDHLEDAGWLDMSNQAASLEIGLGGVPLSEDPASSVSVALMGVDDPHIFRDRLPTPPAAWNDPNALRLGLTHAPYRRVLDEYAALGADLILAGHTHGGQVRVPGFGAVVNNSDLPRRYSRGDYAWNGSKLHISAGLGTSPFAPIRFACRPEATLITLVPSVALDA